MTFELGPILRSIARQKGGFSLVVLELAAGFTVVSALLLASSWYLFLGQQVSGYEERDLLGVVVQVPAAEQHEPGADLARIRAIPGVLAAAPVSTSLADERWAYPSEVRAPGTAAATVGWSLQTTPALFDVLALRVLEGTLPRGGALERDEVVVVTRALRDRLFGAGPALGRTVASEDAAPGRVVAVIDDINMRMPFLPSTRALAIHLAGAPDEREFRYLVRVAPGGRDRLVEPVRAALGPAGPARYVTVTPVDSRSARHASIATGLVTMLGIVCVTVGVLGVLGVMAMSWFLVTERTRQIGIRRALGGTRGDIIRYFLLETSLAALLGTGLGLVTTLLLFLFMQRVFSELAFAWRYLVFTAVSLWATATLAAMIPAFRAAKIPPSVAARST